MLLMQSMMPLSSSPASSTCTSGGETSIAFWITRQPYILFDSFSTSPYSWPTTALRSSAVPISRRRCTTWHPETSLESCATSGSTASQRARRLEGLAASRRAWRSWLPCASRASSPAWRTSSLSERSHFAPSRRTSRSAALHPSPPSPPMAASSRLPAFILRLLCILPIWNSFPLGRAPIGRPRFALACATIADCAVRRFGYIACIGYMAGGATPPAAAKPEGSIGMKYGFRYMPAIGCAGIGCICCSCSCCSCCCSCICCICCGCAQGGYCAGACGGSFPRAGFCRRASETCCWGM
mmetsp:Transcript_49097/g.129793  ORF Transcript_49097/g.129793 Transcript_49097/m.129793 type:complete len:297 (-) Transcript_49097:159-1049(-)